MNFLDRVASVVSPSWGVNRLRSRAALELALRHFEGASTGRRTQGWKRPSSDVNVAQGGLTIQRIRDAARDLVRNNPFAESALDTIAQHTVGWGILPTIKNEKWKRWAETTACDADGQEDLVGLSKLVIRSTAESGEVLVRRRWRRPDDGFPLPFQLQVLESDFLDTSKNTTSGFGLAPGNRIVQGVEYNILGQRVAYWLFKEHPGSALATAAPSFRVPASEVRHIFRRQRPGQVRAVSWFAPVLLRFKDTDEYEDATIMKQKIAACLAVMVTDTDGSGESVGTTTSDEPEIDSLEPGMIKSLKPGQSIEVINPPTATDYEPFTRAQYRAIATGLGLTYEDLTGDYTNLPYSAARMSRLRHLAKVNDWQQRIIIGQFLDPVWAWSVEAAALVGESLPGVTDWTVPALPMIDVDKEALAFLRTVRSGADSLSGAIRALGYDPETHLAQIAADFKKIDDLGITLDSDPRKMTQAGQLQGTAAASQAAAAAPSNAASE